MDLQTVFPRAFELPSRWQLDAWWSAKRGTEVTGLCRVYLNGGGTDHELRFLVFPPGERWRSDQSLWPDCDRCQGKGKVQRPQHSPSPFLSALFEEGQDFDPVDEEGLRRCDALNCIQGRTEPIYGAANSRVRLPGFPLGLLPRTGARGLSQPTRAEVLEVMNWCDDMLERIYRRKEKRYP